MASIKKSKSVETKSRIKSALTSTAFLTKLREKQSDIELEKILKYFKEQDGSHSRDKFMGVKMGQVFALAKEFMTMDLKEVEKLLESPIHEARVGAVSIMDFQARDKKTPDAQKEKLFKLYINRHDRINNWDLVDRSAPYVVGGHLYDKSRKILYTLARSKDPWERRTSIVATYYFIRNGEVSDTFKIAEILVHDKHDLINKATGSWLRTAGIKDPERLMEFLDQYAATMPRVTLRYALEHQSKRIKEYYMRRSKE